MLLEKLSKFLVRVTLPILHSIIIFDKDKIVDGLALEFLSRHELVDLIVHPNTNISLYGTGRHW